MLELCKRPLLVDSIRGKLKRVESDVAGHAPLLYVVLGALNVEDADEDDNLATQQEGEGRTSLVRPLVRTAARNLSLV